MSKPITHVFVIAAEGRLVPVPPSEATAAGASLLTLKASEEKGKPLVYVLPWTTYTRRRIGGGDLFLTDRSGTKVGSPDKARADGIKLEADGTVATDQRPDEEINKAAAEERAAADAKAAKHAELERGKVAPPAPGKDR